MLAKQSPVLKKNPVNYFGKHVWVLKICGLSLTGNESVVYKIYSFVLIFLCVFAYPLLDTYEMSKHDFETASDILIYIVSGLMALFKVIAVLRNRFKLGKLLASLQEEQFLPNSERGGGDLEENLIKECVWLTKLQTYLSWCIMVFIISSVTLYTVIIRIRSNDYHDWKLSYGPLTILNVTYSPNYEVSLVYQSTSILHISTIFTTVDLLLGAILAHLAYHFKIVQNIFKRVVKASSIKMLKDARLETILETPSTVSTVKWKYLAKSLRNAVCYHSEVMNLVEEVEKIFSTLLLSTFLATLCLLCFLIYNASLISLNLRVVRLLTESTITSLQILVVCFWGEQVMHESQQVGKAVYESDFLGTDLRFQKSLIFIMRRSQNPSKLTAGKFVVISLVTFVWVLRTSYSTFMVLQETNAT